MEDIVPMFFVVRIINLLFTLMQLAIIARVFMSWFPMPRDNRIAEILYTITEPVLGPIRTMISRSAFGSSMMFDFSPIVAVILLGILQSIILRLL